MVEISGRRIGRDYPPFLVAEMSGNHNQSLERALSIVEAAAKSGADAIKLQTYTADTMTLNVKEADFLINDEGSLWSGQSLYDLYQNAFTPWEWHEPIFEKCRELGLLAFSTPFDESAVDFLESLSVPCYKIASFENAHLRLIAKAAATHRPLILSTGMATLAELDEAIRTARSAGCEEIILLKCTSSYPATPGGSNIQTIPHMRMLFNCEVGLSDHTMGIGVAVTSVALGATVIEKHFTLRRADGGVDSAFSMEPQEMRMLATEIQNAWQSLGEVAYGVAEEEKQSIQFRRSLYVCEDMREGDVFTEKNVRVVRPGYGLSPRFYDIVLGRKVRRAVKKGTALTWDLI